MNWTASCSGATPAGARIGYQLAADVPRRVAALVAQGTVDARGDDDPAGWLEAAAEVRANGLAAVLGDEHIPPGLLENLLETDAEVVARGSNASLAGRLGRSFRRIAAPTLIVAGELEDEGCAEAAAEMPNGRAVILPGLDHVGAFARSDAVLPHVLPFLREAT